MWFHRYTLRPRTRLNALAAARPREGALLRTGDGFADVHPWPELGDAPLDEQLALLARGETTPLTRRSLWFASVWRPDLFDGVTVPRSHWPAAAGDPPPGFDTVKVKMPGGSWPEGYRLRLDFNASVDAETFSRIAETLPRERIDFVEDPCPYDEEVWDRLREQTGLRLALDRASAVVPPASRRLIRRLAADFVVVKPAVEDLPETDLPIIITSYMDHPIGQLHAGYVASAAGRRRISRRDAGGTCTCGLVTHVLYEPDAFIERMTIADGRLVPPDFTELLESLPWKKLS